MTDRDDLRAAARYLFGDVGERPAGRPHQISLAEVEDYSRRWVENKVAGRVTVVDADIQQWPDGSPKAVGHTVTIFRFNSFAIDRATADRLGIAAAIEAGDYPGVRVFDPHNTEGNDR